MKPEYIYDENKGTTTCILRDKSGNVVIGIARCHPEEKIKSNRIGEYIATIRAEIKYYQIIRKTELLPKMKAIGHIYSCIFNNGEGKYDKNSPEAKLIKREYYRLYYDYKCIGDMIKRLRLGLRAYIEERDNLAKNN